jgi:hypothetical protein
MKEQINPPVCKAVPSPCKKRSDDGAHNCNSTISFEPTMKRQRFSSPSTIDFNRRLSSGSFSLNSYHTSSDSPGGSSRINNIRCVSDASIRATKDCRPWSSSEGTISSMANYFCSSDSVIGKKLTNHPILDDNDLLAAKSVNGSWSSSVPSLKRICDAIDSLHGSTGTDEQSELNISHQCYYLAAWTKSNAPADNESRPPSTTNLTLHQVALAIVSCNGITRVLDAMDAHPDNIEIQENGCMVLGNILAILYRRKMCNVLSYDRYLGEATIQLGNSIFSQIIQTMRNHQRNVAVYSAAIPALQQYYLSVLVSQPNDTILEYQRMVLQNAREMFLPSHVQQVLRTTTSLSERFAIHFR